MPRYRDNQFISNFLKPQAGEKTNAPFIYPRRRIRTADQWSADVEGTTFNRVYRRSKELDRGFMRNLSSPGQTQVGEFKRQRLNFQFNPSDILQSVQMRQDVYLPILQDPSQYAQPMSAVASFNFDLLFDRTMEVGRGGSNEARGGTVDVFGDSSPTDSVYQIGVLSDLQVLYSIIGQGFSNDFINQQLETIKQLAKAQLLNDGDDGNDTEVASIEAATSESFSGSANLGNNAFLIPMPVRIVFSELFMVDGFVTSTSVRFTKFNTNMVPIQASVGLSMNALYIGFAKEDTFLTVQLENQAENIKNANIEKIEISREAFNAATQSARKFVFTCDDSGEWLAGLGTASDEMLPVSNYAVETAPRQFKVGFKDAKSQGDNDKILKLFENGQVFSVSYNWKFKVYGTYSTTASAVADVARKKASQTLRGLYYVDESVASDADSWKVIRSDSLRPEDSDKYGYDPGTNRATSPLSGVSSDYTSSIFVVNLEGYVKIGDTVKRINEWKTIQGNGDVYFEVPLDWPNFNAPYQIPDTPSSTGRFNGSVGSVRDGFIT